MQRRHAIIAAIALVALVLIPAAVLALGPGGGLGHRGGGIDPKNVSGAAPAWAGNTTARHLGVGNCTGAGDCGGNASCIGNQTCGRDRLGPQGGDCARNITAARDPHRTALRERGSAVNRTGTNTTACGSGMEGRGGRGACR